MVEDGTAQDKEKERKGKKKKKKKKTREDRKKELSDRTTRATNTKHASYFHFALQCHAALLDSLSLEQVELRVAVPRCRDLRMPHTNPWRLIPPHRLLSSRLYSPPLHSAGLGVSVWPPLYLKQQRNVF
jgi:hypothetical protein